MYEGHYTIYRLPCEPADEGKGALRPEIQIETAVFPLQRPAVELPVRSFMAEGFSAAAEVAKIECASIAETAAEKLVALTRRAGAELAGPRDKRDPTLVRHVYDLHAIRDRYNATDVASLAREIMISDADQRRQVSGLPEGPDRGVAESNRRHCGRRGIRCWLRELPPRHGLWQRTRLRHGGCDSQDDRGTP